MMQAKNIPLSKIQPNTGQVEGLPKNPRILRDERFAALKKSIEDDPEMLDLRELLVYPIDGGKYVVIGGNMRLRVLQDLKAKDAPCKVIPKDTPVAKLSYIEPLGVLDLIQRSTTPIHLTIFNTREGFYA